MLTKGENGIWSGTTVRPVRPGAWRYTFNVDGVTVVDSRNVNVTTSQTQVQSMLYVPGDFSETRDVPHGTVGLARYVAKSLGGARREMYVYTPPGYEKGTARYPVLYLIHGGGDTALYAFDKATGREVARMDIGRRASGTPMTYRTKSGRQFIVMATGAGANAVLVAWTVK